MQSYSWPGNVRELRNTIERVVIMYPGTKVSAGDLPPQGKDEPPAASFRSRPLKKRPRPITASSSSANSKKLTATSHAPPS
jgi:DNA-binding NtrC family response regulator